MNSVIKKLEEQNLKSDIPDFRVGDTVREWSEFFRCIQAGSKKSRC